VRANDTSREVIVANLGNEGEEKGGGEGEGEKRKKAIQFFNIKSVVYFRMNIYFHAGDSRVIMGQHDESGNLHTVTISTDHTADSERSRIKTFNFITSLRGKEERERGVPSIIILIVCRNY
jgi:hypothetical protein